MWIEITRPKYERKGLGYSSDLSDAEWLMIEPRLPQRSRLGRPPKTEMRSVVNELLYMVNRPPVAAVGAGVCALNEGPTLFLRVA
jgi:hypothetical protein